MKLPEEIFEYVKENNPEAALEFQSGDVGEPWILVEADSLKSIMKFLRDDPGLAFDVLMCLSGIHYPKEEELGVAYHVNSTSLGHSLALKVRVPVDHPHVPSVESIWKTANWHEREAWDMVGIKFDDHPNHKRILCAEDWEGHPLRKDYVQQEFYQGMPTGE
ncbi:MAG: NADH-quinone oxidoreductase subunit C [Bacteroidetes bacterium]|jgi:NADH-quinone oxidoreductase subunit C|nr:NADH-quinone oxidoreductase subunit C [Bacteroidota bacterium]